MSHGLCVTYAHGTELHWSVAVSHALDGGREERVRLLPGLRLGQVRPEERRVLGGVPRGAAAGRRVEPGAGGALDAGVVDEDACVYMVVLWWGVGVVW